MSIRHRLLNIGTGFTALWLAWALIQVFTSPIIAQGLRAVVVLGVAAVILNATGKRIIDFVKSASIPLPNLPHRRSATVPPTEDDYKNTY
ncbi:hypothetical protein [Halobacillus halophilus]|uniref:hypothetical protein n=1 Tax=Halobacillus halophilus TaxID=1570 RepID=UPI001CD4DCBA|nr:hypothetical protein [Halobacillus halophilus]MCA1012810.1 hypothetical protein [Halobacillus halophilus]